jgi:ATP-binding protein involved in chromosome partitioning
MIDPRPSVVRRRLSEVGRVAAFCSAKGGVGKTMCTVLAGLVLSGRGKSVGLLDLDLQGSTAHLFLGVRPAFPREEKGILPLDVTPRLGLMSASMFAADRALALRGPEVSDAILELLAVTQWGHRDCLLIDMPPGIGEEVMDLARLVPGLQAFVVSTPSVASTAVVERLLGFLVEMRVAVAGVVANMTRADAAPVRALAARFNVPFAGEVAWEADLEKALGSPRLLEGSRAAMAVRAALEEVGW